jgi:hypothetical protein
MKSILLVLALAILASSFSLEGSRDDSIVIHETNGIPWPFTLCGDGKWDIKNLTLGSVPKKNTNNDIDVVIISFI